MKAQDYQAPETGYPYVMICEGRLKSTISMEVIHEEKPTQLVIAASGDSWYEAKSTLEFILSWFSRSSLWIPESVTRSVCLWREFPIVRTGRHGFR